MPKEVEKGEKKNGFLRKLCCNSKALEVVHTASKPSLQLDVSPLLSICGPCRAMKESKLSHTNLIMFSPIKFSALCKATVLLDLATK